MSFTTRILRSTRSRGPCLGGWAHGLRLPLWHFFVLAIVVVPAGEAPRHVLSAEAPKPAMSIDPGSDLAEALRSEDRREHGKARRLVEGQYWRIAEAASRVIRGGVKDAKQQHGVAMAMCIIARVRATECVPILVENITFTYEPPAVSATLRGFVPMPAVAALMCIGLPSLDPLVKRVAETDDHVVRERAAIVIDRVLGTDFGVLFVEDRRDREEDETSRQRLTRLAEQIDTVERNRQRKFTLAPLNPPPVVKRSPK